MLFRWLKQPLLDTVEIGRRHDVVEAFVNNLELVAKRDFATLMRLCGVGMDDITGMVEEIRALDPSS